MPPSITPPESPGSLSAVRAVLEHPAPEVAPLLLGAFLRVESPEGTVTVRLTEVEAYHGPVDPGSHAYRGRTERNKVMFGPAGHLYTYFTYGMHTCANIVCAPEGTGSGVLLRAGEVVEGLELARVRRSSSRTDADLARGPARLVVATGITLADGGADVLGSRVRLELRDPVEEFLQGPRTGVSGPGGTDEFPWRFWIPGDRTVSPYKAATTRPRSR